MVMYVNGESVQKTIKKIFVRKIVDDCIPLVMIEQCLHGHADLVQVCFSVRFAYQLKFWAAVFDCFADT